MKIWLITIGEPWPIDGVNPRLHRTGTMARLYARGGDDVVWFNNVFDHYAKKHRVLKCHVVQIEPHLTIVGLKGRAYTKNISLRRILHHRDNASHFNGIADSLPSPDIIVASMPSLELSQAAVRFGEHHKVPVVVDIRDLWPDIFLEVLPRPLQKMGKLALLPFEIMLRESIRKATAVSGVTDHAVAWALDRVTRNRGRFDGPLPLAYSRENILGSDLEAAGNYWDSLGVRSDKTVLNVCYMGGLSRRVELDTVLEAAKKMPSDMRGQVRFVICGAGERADDIRACANVSPFLIAPGWIDAAQIQVLMDRSQIGILPYPNSQDWPKLLPNKFFDYVGGGLPILTCLRGVLGDLITKSGAGWLYRNNDAEDLIGCLRMLSADRDRVAAAAACAERLAKMYSAEQIYGDFRSRLVEIVKSKPDRTEHEVSKASEV